MIQLSLIFVSLGYGIIFGYFYSLLSKRFKNKNIYYYLFILIYFIVITIGFLFTFIILNHGDIHIYLKLMLLIGFILSNKLSNLRKQAFFS